MEIGIVGLPNVGKSTLFNAITNSSAEAANYPFCTIEPNVGIAIVKDERIDKLSVLYKTKKTTYATVKFIDIAGLVKGASRGEGLGNKFLSHIKEVDAILHVVRCFEAEIIHVDDKVDPRNDIGTINLELILADLDFVSKRLIKLQKTSKHEKNDDEILLLEKLKSAFEDAKLARNLEFDENELNFVKSYNLITLKPMIYAANTGENNSMTENKYVEIVKIHANSENSPFLKITAKIEQEIANLPDSEKDAFLKEMGLMESGLDRLTKIAYKTLNLISFITAGEPEVRAWTITNGSNAQVAARKIHTDFAKGFIRAEVIAYDDFIQIGDLAKARERGLIRSEGKEYIVKNGDIIHFLFSKIT